MNTQYKFVKGNGDLVHEKKLQEAYEEGYAVKQMLFNPSHTGTEANKEVVVLLEKILRLN